MAGFRMIKLFSLGLFGAFILILGIQLLKWEQFSVDMTWFQIKKMTGQTRVSDWLSYGAICNSLKKNSCAVEAFREVLRHQPQNRIAIANLAINYCHMGRWKESLPLFAAYFSLKGSGYDVMYWYARAFNNSGEPEKSVQWYYNSLNKKHDYIDAAKELVDLLMGTKRWFEAFSLVAQLTNGHPEKDVYWSQKLLSMNAFMWEQIKKNSDSHVHDTSEVNPMLIRLPAFVDEHFFLPFWFAPHDPVHFLIVVDDKEEKAEKNDLVIDAEILNPEKLMQLELNHKTPDNKSSMEITYLQIGPWTFNKISSSLCQKCEMKVSYKKINEWGINIKNQIGSINFLLLFKEEIKK